MNDYKDLMDTTARPQTADGLKAFWERGREWIKPIGVAAGLAIPATAAVISSCTTRGPEYLALLFHGTPQQEEAIVLTAVAAALAAISRKHSSNAKRQEEILMAIMSNTSQTLDQDDIESLRNEEKKVLLSQIEQLSAQNAQLRLENRLIRPKKDTNMVTFDDHISN